MQMPGRSYSNGSEYRYGFNGKEKDAETTTQDYGMRIYDARLGRFLSVDPLIKNYPMLTPYQFSSNRPIDGIDMDGMEYLSFNVTVTKNADGNPIFTVSIAKDFRGLTGEQVAAVHGRGKAYAKKFYENYSESFGPEGRGFKFTYFDANGKQIGEPVWQMKQSKILSIANSGYYSGSGAITLAGPGLEENGTGYLNNQYDFGYKPMNYADKISLDHDAMQEIEIVQPQGWLEDTRTLKSDRILLQAAKDGIKNNLVGSKEDLARTKNIKTFFSLAIIYKEWKLNQMASKGYDANSISDQRKVILKNWHPTIFKPKQWFAKMILTLSGGGAKSNSVKPVEKKSP